MASSSQNDSRASDSWNVRVGRSPRRAQPSIARPLPMPHHALHESLCLRILDEKLVCIEKYRREYELKNKSCSSTVVL